MKEIKVQNSELIIKGILKHLMESGFIDENTESVNLPHILIEFVNSQEFMSAINRVAENQRLMSSHRKRKAIKSSRNNQDFLSGQMYDLLKIKKP